MNRFVRVLIALPALLLWGCRDAGSPTVPAPTPPAFEIAHGGALSSSPNFTSLPPLVDESAVSGPFDPFLFPTVLVCELRDDACGCYVAGFLRITGSKRIEVDAAEEAYEVTWNTAGFDIDLAHTYRILVFAVGRKVGHIDLENVQPGDVIPIRFRITEGLRIQIAAVTAGDAHTCALASEGEMFCWGENGSGQLGDGSTIDRTTPERLPGGSASI